MYRRICHYCGGVGNTRDHIVARCWYNARHVPQMLAELNKVWACGECNQAKGHSRSDCECEICMQAWEVMAPFILPRKKSDIPIVPLLARQEGAG